MTGILNMQVIFEIEHKYDTLNCLLESILMVKWT
jgi:hypothetical protein